MTDRNTARVQMVTMVFAALIFAWNVFDAWSMRNRYFAAAAMAVFTFAAAWKFLQYRQRFRAVR